MVQQRCTRRCECVLSNVERRLHGPDEVLLRRFGWVRAVDEGFPERLETGSGATATATLANFLPERIVVTHGTNKTEFVYGNFQDFNNPLFKIEALYAGTIVERRNGTVVRQLTSKVTEVGQVYVVVPVPDSVRTAGK